MPALTLTEARERAGLLRVATMVVTLDLTDDTAFRSSTRIEFDCTEPGASTFLDVVSSQLVSATLNGAPLDIDTCRDARLPLTGLAANNVVEVDALMEYSHDGEGLHAHVDPTDGRRYVYAMSFLDAAPRWFACFDQPDLKTRVELLVTAPSAWTVLGNGPAELVEELQGGRTWRLAAPEPLATYVVTLAAGEWASVHAEHDGIPLGVHAKQSLAAELEAQAGDILATTTESFDDYHEAFDVRYPFGEYHQVFVPDFNAGAMENPGCVLLRDSMLFRGRASEHEVASRAGTAAHELAHMWFGNLVTMRWWDDLWLNESFAEYAAHRVVSARGRHPLWLDFGMDRKVWGGTADRSPSTHPVAASGAQDTDAALMNFDGISYAKGAALLRQLAKRLGDDVFLAGLRAHFHDFAFGNATMEDLLERWEAAGATDLRAWADAWLRTTGMDTVTVSGDTIEVAGPDGGPSPREHVVDVARIADDGEQTWREERTLRQGMLRLPEGRGRLVPDAGDDAWAVVRFVEPGEAAHPEQRIAHVADPSTRVALWTALRWSVRDALVDPGALVDVVLSEVPDEPEELILGPVLGWLTKGLIGTWLPIPDRVDAAEKSARVLADQLERAEAGSDRRLLLLRALLSTTHDVAWLEAFLAGGDEESRDPELRWSALERLAALTADLGPVITELEERPSASALVHTARARALVPTTDAKVAALQTLLTDPVVPPHELYATGEGLFHGEHAALCEPLAIRWCEGLPELGRLRKGWVLGKSAQASFPDSVATPAVLAAAEAALRTELAPAVRRVVVDGTERLRLVLASHAAFPARNG